MKIQTRSKDGVPAVRGTCPVCRLPNLRVRHRDGKIGFHGKTAAATRGCAGVGEPPLRRGRDGVEREQAGATVVGFTRPGADGGAVPPVVISMRPPPPTAS